MALELRLLQHFGDPRVGVEGDGGADDERQHAGCPAQAFHGVGQTEKRGGDDGGAEVKPRMIPFPLGL